MRINVVLSGKNEMRQEVWQKVIWSFLGIVLLTAAGFLAGFSMGRQNKENCENNRKERHRQEDMIYWSVGSPVSGEIACVQEGEHPTVVIIPREDKLYAPAGGKITKLFPMGNEFLFRTEFGAELHIRTGEADDEMLARYFRPRIVQNEIVAKGKLLLEFDRYGLEAEGSSPKVSVRLENSIYGSDILLTAEECIKTGEEILRVTERCCHDDTYRD